MRSTKTMAALVVSFVIMSTGADAAKILGFLPFHGLSHNRVTMSLFIELAKRGHDMTVVGYHEPKDSYPSYRTVLLKKEAGQELRGFFSVGDFTGDAMSTMHLLNRILDQYSTLIGYKKVHKAFEREYDLVIAEYLESDVFSYFEWMVNAPVILFHTSEPLPWHCDAFGDPIQPSIVMHAYSTRNSVMNFVGRFWNTVEIAQMMLFYHTVIAPKAQKMVEEQFGPLPPLSELTKNASLYFINTHFSLSGSRPANPSTIEVGGLHITEAKPLPKDLQTLFDNAKNGVIYFSMGSTLRGTSISSELKNVLLKAFAMLNQTILWKWEEDLPGKPAHVHINPWFPQRDILAHPNLVLYIGQCGSLGVFEAVTEAVPVICIPVFADQFFNAASLARKGMGLNLRKFDINESLLFDAIQKVLNNASFKHNARLVSAAFKDRPLSAMDTAVYWAEYVIRHRGAPHIKSPARYMAWWEYYNVDVLVALLLIVLTAVAITYKISIALVYFIVRACSLRAVNKLKNN